MLKKQTIFIQSYGTYTNEVLVIVGIEDKKKVFKFLKKARVKADMSKWILENFDDWVSALKTKNKGQFCFNDKGDGGTVLMLRQTHDSWEYWEILLHETNHIVHHLAKMRGMTDEMEAQAYLQEFLFHSIRRKLQGVDKIEN